MLFGQGSAKTTLPDAKPMREELHVRPVIAVRQATPADLGTLNRFQEEVVTTERPFDRTLKQGPVQYYDIARMLVSDHIRFLVAESGADVVGCGFARIETAKHYLQHPTYAYLGLMYVTPEYRGQSVNRAIINALTQWCVSRGITELRLEVYNDNTAAIRAYEKAGFGKLMLEMRLGLNDTTAAVTWPASAVTMGSRES